MIRHKKLAALVALAGLGVAACNAPSTVNNPGSTASSTSQGAPQEKALDPAAKGPAPEVAGAAKGGTILVRAETTPSSMDPTNIYYVDSNEISKLTFRALTQFDMRNGKPVLVPDLADHDVYICGGDRWMDLVRTAALAGGVPERNIHLERFGY